jgi:hypothetical protein
MTDCLNFAKTHKMFHGKYVIVANVQLIVETQTIIVDVNVADVNVTKRSKVTKEQMFEDREPRKAKSVND